MQTEGGQDAASTLNNDDPNRRVQTKEQLRLLEDQRLRNERTKNGICKAFLHSECKRENCPHKHDKKSAEYCKNFEHNNYCSKGDKCDYRHDQEPLDANKVCKEFKLYGSCVKGDKCPQKHKKIICKDYERGFCPDGPRCKNYHEQRQACPSYMLGFCPKGPDCNLAHPKLFFDFDEAFFEKMEPEKQSLVKCRRCNMIGHKLPACQLEKEFPVQSSGVMPVNWGGTSGMMGAPAYPPNNPPYRPQGSFGAPFSTPKPPPPATPPPPRGPMLPNTLPN